MQHAIHVEQRSAGRRTDLSHHRSCHARAPRLGPGLLKTVYERCLCYEPTKAAIPFRRQVPVPVHYDDVVLERGSTADIIVDDEVILEPKVVAHVLPIHEVQLLTYLRLTRRRIGLLINFNTISLTDHIHRRVL